MLSTIASCGGVCKRISSFGWFVLFLRLSPLFGIWSALDMDERWPLSRSVFQALKSTSSAASEKSLPYFSNIDSNRDLSFMRLRSLEGCRLGKEVVEAASLSSRRRFEGRSMASRLCYNTVISRYRKRRWIEIANDVVSNCASSRVERGRARRVCLNSDRCCLLTNHMARLLGHCGLELPPTLHTLALST